MMPRVILPVAKLRRSIKAKMEVDGRGSVGFPTFYE